MTHINRHPFANRSSDVIFKSPLFQATARSRSCGELNSRFRFMPGVELQSAVQIGEPTANATESGGVFGLVPGAFSGFEMRKSEMVCVGRTPQRWPVCGDFFHSFLQMISFCQNHFQILYLAVVIRCEWLRSRASRR